MNIRFQKTPRGEVAILPRKEYEALIAKASEVDEDKGTVRLGQQRQSCAGIARMARKIAGICFLKNRAQPELHF